MKKIIIILLFLFSSFAYSQDSTKTDSTEYKSLTARYQKIQKQYFELKDELMRYEGRLQMLEVLIREEELKLRIKF